jgi:hypothetical protein
MNSTRINGKSNLALVLGFILLLSAPTVLAKGLRTAGTNSMPLPGVAHAGLVAYLDSEFSPTADDPDEMPQNVQAVEFPPIGDSLHPAFGLSASARFPVGEQLFIHLDLVAHRILGGGQESLFTQTVTQTQVRLGWQVMPHVVLFAGPSLGLSVFELGDRAQVAQIGGSGCAANPIEAAPGFMVGLQLL